jgi:hypothetical protein
MSGNPTPDNDQSEVLVTLYDRYRTVALNQKYYGARMEMMKTRNLALEFAILIGSSGGAVAGWAVWQSALGAPAWAAITAVTAVLAILKPFLKLQDAVERYSKLWAAYGALRFDFQSLVESVPVRRGLSEPDLARAESTWAKVRELVASDDVHPARKLILACQDEVDREIPVSRLWLPNEFYAVPGELYARDATESARHTS